jgi:hypothetical protein
VDGRASGYVVQGVCSGLVRNVLVCDCMDVVIIVLEIDRVG